MERAKHRARTAYGMFGKAIWRKRWRLFVNWWIDIRTSVWYVCHLWLKGKAGLNLLTGRLRTLSSRGLLRDLWENSLPSKIIITRLYAATSIYSKSSNWVLPCFRKKATCFLRTVTMFYQIPHIRIASYLARLHGSSIFDSRYNTTCIIKSRLTSLPELE